MEQFLIKFTILCVCIINPIFSLECKVSPENVQRPGKTVTFTCSTDNSNSSIVFRNNGQKMAITSIVEEGSIWTYEVSRVVDENDNFAIFKCSERFPNGNAPKAECELKTPLEIVGKAVIDPPYQIISHGDDAVFVCNGETVPAISYYNWWVEKENIDILPANRFVKEDGGRILRIRNVTEDLNQSEIKCRVGNVVEDKRSRANAKSFLFIEGMPMPTNFTMMPVLEVVTVTPTSQPNTAEETNLLDLKLYFIIGAAGTLVFSIFFICSLCIIKMKKDHRQDRKKSISKDPTATDKFDEVERARPNSYSELPKNTGKTIEPVSQWKVVAMDSFRADEEPDFGPAKLYPGLDDEDTNIYENMDTLGNAKGANDNKYGYASMASMKQNL